MPGPSPGRPRWPPSNGKLALSRRPRPRREAVPAAALSPRQGALHRPRHGHGAPGSASLHCHQGHDRLVLTARAAEVDAAVRSFTLCLLWCGAMHLVKESRLTAASSGRHVDSPAAPLPHRGVHRWQLARFDQMSNVGLRQAEPVRRLGQSHPACWCVSSAEASPYRLAEHDPPRCARRRLLSGQDPFPQPAMDRGHGYPELGRCFVAGEGALTRVAGSRLLARGDAISSTHSSTRLPMRSHTVDCYKSGVAKSPKARQKDGHQGGNPTLATAAAGNDPALAGW